MALDHLLLQQDALVVEELVLLQLVLGLLLVLLCVAYPTLEPQDLLLEIKRMRYARFPVVKLLAGGRQP